MVESEESLVTNMNDIRGKFDNLSLVSLAQQLGENKSTGSLNITSQNRCGKIYFANGKIYFATIDNQKRKIGELLRDAGFISEIQLQEALVIQSMNENKTKLGEVIADIKMRDNEPIDDAIDGFVKGHIFDAISAIFHIEEGEFQFIYDEIAVEANVCVYVDPSQIISVMKEQLDEWRELKKFIPSPEAIIELNERPPTLSPPLDALLVTAEQWKVVLAISQSTKRLNIREIREKLELSAISCYRLLMEMIKNGIIKIKSDNEVVQINLINNLA